MFSEYVVKILKQIAWVVFFLVLGLESVNLVYREKDKLFQRQLPFNIEDSVATAFHQDGLAVLFANKTIIAIDSIYIQSVSTDDDDSTIMSPNGPVISRMKDKSVHISIGSDQESKTNFKRDGIEEHINEYIQNKFTVVVTLRDKETGKIVTIRVETQKQIDTRDLYKLIALILLLIFTFFNSYLLLRYSQSNENVLIVFFLIFLITPSLEYVPIKLISDIWSKLISPFWGIFFYHFIQLKISSTPDVRKLYLRSTVLYLIVFVLGFLSFSDIFEIILYVWPTYWLLKGIIQLRREYRISQKIEFRRLLSAFQGISISGVGILVVLGGILLLVTLLPGAQLLIKSAVLSKILGITFAFTVVLGVLTVLIGVFWFFCSFTWSLLTGTALDVKIRSTLIFTIVGIVFVTVFGLIDYALGELLQYLFGKFVGSEFIAGIPGTIVLISLYTPFRNRVEKIVDRKLNSSELDFLEQTDSFARNLTEDGVVEGFEEYICENLIRKLSIEKVALVSYDPKLEGYRFNEIRGSDVLENSLVEDSQRILTGELVHNIHEETLDNPQDIASFPLIMPIIFDDEHKWFLALGGKKDGSIYNKNELASFIKLIDKIRLSLKFILVYEDLVDGRYEKTIHEKDEIISQLRRELEEKHKRNT